jgi:hypothetical protein
MTQGGSLPTTQFHVLHDPIVDGNLGYPLLIQLPGTPLNLGFKKYKLTFRRLGLLALSIKF